jgi:hypothetical protein
LAGAGIAAGLLLILLPARAQQVLTPWNVAAQQAWWTANPTPDTWPKAVDALQTRLEAAYKQGGVGSFSDPDFQGWMEHLEWLRLAINAPDLLITPADVQAFIALGKDETLSHVLVRKLLPRDNRKGALQVLLLLAEANMADLHEYAALGVAYAIVFDEPFPADWPHAQVPQSAVPFGDFDVVKRFQFYVQSNRDHKLENDLTQLSVDELKHLVDSKVKLSELAYAQKNTIPYDHFDQAFFSIRYDGARISGDAAYTWQEPTYLLADIERDGGICVDQAYYATELGKGRGIPTIYFIGQGTGGGHAWFGYLTKSGKWNLDCGRYESQNYPHGYALDPQTWQVVDDTTLATLAKNGDAERPDWQPAKNALAWARLHDGTPLCLQALEQARSLSPDFPAAWQAEGDYLTTSHASEEDQKSFYNDWIKQFQALDDMRVEGQKRLLAVLKAANDPDAESVERDLTLQNRSENVDFGAQGSISGIQDKFKAQDFDGARVAFEAAVRDFKDQGGGSFFYDVIRPYVMLCVQYGRYDQADDGIHFVDERMQIDPYSIIGADFTALKGDLKKMKVALPAVDQWLAEMDGGNYAQAWTDSSDFLQKMVTSDQWVAYITRQRQPLGKLNDRQLAGPPEMHHSVRLRGGQEMTGDFLREKFQDNFQNKSNVSEEVSFMREPDNSWRIFGYDLRDGSGAAGN